ncbi:CRISPR-associated endonuclease Cas2 [Fusobacterium sp. PH5-44]|uniref:CRISPR-associated endonuclease Cas2 n=1 Tax=unclassified Fusobacterium TaxID=2648384 RepID=UPI003D205B6F
MTTKYIGLLMYDLPSQTILDSKNYRRFRKFLIKKGYYQLQESVYIIKSNTKEYIENIENLISIHSNNDDASIRSLILTEDQFLKMKILSGIPSFGEELLKGKKRLLEY